MCNQARWLVREPDKTLKRSTLVSRLVDTGSCRKAKAYEIIRQALNDGDILPVGGDSVRLVPENTGAEAEQGPSGIEEVELRQVQNDPAITDLGEVSPGGVSVLDVEDAPP